MEDKIHDYLEKRGWEVRVEKDWETVPYDNTIFSYKVIIQRRGITKEFESGHLGLAYAMAVRWVSSHRTLKSLNLLGWFQK